jgi:glycosyltransferase involved in cell wall biosynthesis
VDDGSKDRTKEVARRFASKQILVVSKENQGAAATRNHALRLGQGDYIQWLDADDILAPDKIASQIAGLRECDGKKCASVFVVGILQLSPPTSEVHSHTAVAGPFSS